MLYPGSYVSGNLRAHLRGTSFLIDRRYGCSYLAVSTGPASLRILQRILDLSFIAVNIVPRNFLIGKIVHPLKKYERFLISFLVAP